jgi:predicted nucleic acid-binding protein
LIKKKKKSRTNYSLKNINARNGRDKRDMERLKIAVESKAANMKVGSFNNTQLGIGK